jgi:hypothetical protein
VKPLPAEPLTTEDFGIWVRSVVRFAKFQGELIDVGAFSRRADRRDAELMWWAQRHPEHYDVIPASTDPADPLPDSRARVDCAPGNRVRGRVARCNITSCA